MPEITCPRDRTDSKGPSNFVAVSASTSHASVAPEKKVKPSPSNADTTAHHANGECSCQSSTYSAVAIASVSVPHRNEVRRPQVSATTPVGISKITMPAV